MILWTARIRSCRKSPVALHLDLTGDNHFYNNYSPTRIASFGMLCIPQAGAQAPSYPLKPITVLVGIGAGSNTDVLARIAAKRLSERLKQPVLVENRPGAGGTIASATVAGAPADGYTLLWASSSIPLFPHIYQNLKLDPIKDLIGVVGVARSIRPR